MSKRIHPLDRQERRTACVVVMLFAIAILVLVAWEAGSIVVWMIEP